MSISYQYTTDQVQNFKGKSFSNFTDENFFGNKAECVRGNPCGKDLLEAAKSVLCLNTVSIICFFIIMPCGLSHIVTCKLFLRLVALFHAKSQFLCLCSCQALVDKNCLLSFNLPSCSQFRYNFDLKELYSISWQSGDQVFLC